MQINSVKVTCLNPKVFINPSYRKNPIIYHRAPDFYLKVPCGRCRLCRKRFANDWKVRLLKEFETTPTHLHNGKQQPRVAFVTLTIEDKYYTDDDSLFAPYFVKFRDNYRKRYGKSPRYWAVTDRGAKEGRLHLHMLLFNPYDYKQNRPVSLTELHKVHFWWSYGYTDEEWTRKGLANATYCVGYLTDSNIKKDAKKHGCTLCEKARTHVPKLYVSKGIGKGYDTKENYLAHKNKPPLIQVNGFIYGLPRYYKYKWFSKDERYKQNQLLQQQTLNYYKQFGYSYDFINGVFGGLEKFENMQLTGFVDTPFQYEMLRTKQSHSHLLYAMEQLRRFDLKDNPKFKLSPSRIDVNRDFYSDLYLDNVAFKPWLFEQYIPDTFYNLIDDSQFPF